MNIQETRLARALDMHCVTPSVCSSRPHETGVESTFLSFGGLDACN